MKKERRIWMLLAVLLLLTAVLPQPVSANSGPPPNLTIIVTGAPGGVVVTLETADEAQKVSERIGTIVGAVLSDLSDGVGL